MIQKLAKPLKFAGIGTAVLSIILSFVQFGQVHWYERTVKKSFLGYYYYDYSYDGFYSARIIDCEVIGIIFFIFACLLFIFCLLKIIIKKMNNKTFNIIFSSFTVVTAILGILTTIFDTLYIVNKLTDVPDYITSYSPRSIVVGYFTNHFVLHLVFSFSVLLFFYAVFSLVASILEKKKSTNLAYNNPNYNYNQGNVNPNYSYNQGNVNRMICFNCGNNIVSEKEIRFCPKCGAQLTNLPKRKFCTKCGSQVDEYCICRNCNH